MRYKGKIKEINHIIVSDPSYDETVACRYERKEINKKNWKVSIDIKPDVMVEEISNVDIGMDTASVAIGINGNAKEIIDSRNDWQPECCLNTLTDGLFGTVKEGKISDDIVFICISGYLYIDTGYSIEDIIQYLQEQLEITDLEKDSEKPYIVKRQEILEKMADLKLKFKEITKEDEDIIKYFDGDKNCLDITFAEKFLMDIQEKCNQLTTKSPYSDFHNNLISEYMCLSKELEELEREFDKDFDIDVKIEIDYEKIKKTC